jgi:hypothetical protein
MQLTPWFSVLPAVQNGWTFAAFLVIVAIWLSLRRR